MILLLPMAPPPATTDPYINLCLIAGYSLIFLALIGMVVWDVIRR